MADLKFSYSEVKNKINAAKTKKTLENFLKKRGIMKKKIQKEIRDPFLKRKKMKNEHNEIKKHKLMN